MAYLDGMTIAEESALSSWLCFADSMEDVPLLFFFFILLLSFSLPVCHRVHNELKAAVDGWMDE